MSEYRTGDVVKLLRKEANLKQEEFAKLIGMKQSNISTVETNKSDISMTRFFKMCRLVNIKPHEILEKVSKKQIK